MNATTRNTGTEVGEDQAGAGVEQAGPAVHHPRLDRRHDAGDHARDEIGEEGLIASDIVDFLPSAMDSFNAQ